MAIVASAAEDRFDSRWRTDVLCDRRIASRHLNQLHQHKHDRTRGHDLFDAPHLSNVQQNVQRDWICRFGARPRTTLLRGDGPLGDLMMEIVEKMILPRIELRQLYRDAMPRLHDVM